MADSQTFTTHVGSGEEGRKLRKAIEDERIRQNMDLSEFSRECMRYIIENKIKLPKP